MQPDIKVFSLEEENIKHLRLLNLRRKVLSMQEKLEEINRTNSKLLRGNSEKDRTTFAIRNKIENLKKCETTEDEDCPLLKNKVIREQLEAHREKDSRKVLAINHFTRAIKDIVTKLEETEESLRHLVTDFPMKFEKQATLTLCSACRQAQSLKNDGHLATKSVPSLRELAQRKINSLQNEYKECVKIDDEIEGGSENIDKAGSQTIDEVGPENIDKAGSENTDGAGSQNVDEVSFTNLENISTQEVDVSNEEEKSALLSGFYYFRENVCATSNFSHLKRYRYRMKNDAASQKSNETGSQSIDEDGSENIDEAESQNIDEDGSQNIDEDGSQNIDEVSDNNLEKISTKELNISSEVQRSAPSSRSFSSRGHFRSRSSGSNVRSKESKFGNRNALSKQRYKKSMYDKQKHFGKPKMKVHKVLESEQNSYEELSINNGSDELIKNEEEVESNSKLLHPTYKSFPVPCSDLDLDCSYIVGQTSEEKELGPSLTKSLDNSNIKSVEGSVNLVSRSESIQSILETVKLPKDTDLGIETKELQTDSQAVDEILTSGIKKTESILGIQNLLLSSVDSAGAELETIAVIPKYFTGNCKQSKESSTKVNGLKFRVRTWWNSLFKKKSKND